VGSFVNSPLIGGDGDRDSKGGKERERDVGKRGYTPSWQLALAVYFLTFLYTNPVRA
jgi:hypothetical protein